MGPGGSLSFILEAISFSIMCLTIWFAALCLACADKKGVPRFRYLKTETEDSNPAFVPKKSCLCMCCCPAQVCKYKTASCSQPN